MLARGTRSHATPAASSRTRVQRTLVVGARQPREPLEVLPSAESTISAWERSNWRGQTPGPMPRVIRRAYGGRGGGGCSEANFFVCFLRDQQLRDQQLGVTVAMK
jgi:hypothetical protein